MAKKKRGQKEAPRKAPRRTAPLPHKRVRPPEKPPAMPEPAAEDATHFPSPALPFPVAGIAASAGGLEAFKKFFTALPANSGVAFVLIPHLDPTHPSLMVELLVRHTAMPVVEAADKQRLEPNRVYVIPPNKYMTINGGVLKLTGPVERRHSSAPIDLFLRSLANDMQERAICIILSGTGNHGTLGLKAIKAVGGMAMVQDPETAEYDRMPHSAVATGLADFVLPATQLPEALVKYVQHAYVNGNGDQAATEEQPDHLRKIVALLRARTKHDFNCYRKKMLLRRIERRMGLKQVSDLGAYVQFLRSTSEEVKQLTRDLFISVTSFFRDPEAFHALETQVLPDILARKDGDSVIRVWVPGCATGEEAYTIAMLLLDQVGAASKDCAVQVFATDVDEDALNVGRQGIYPDTIAEDVSPERLARFFTRIDEHNFQVTKQLRECVTFAVQNLIADPPFSKLDLITCRNLLIYLEPNVQSKVLSLLNFALAEHGYLLLGPSETIGRQVDLFEVINKKWRIFRRIGPLRSERIDFPISPYPKRELTALQPAAAGKSTLVSLGELAHQLLLENFAPAAVLINHRGEILFYFGSTTRYLENPSGEPTKDLFVLAREGLRAKLRAAVQQSVHDKATTLEHGIRLRRDGNYFSVTVRVQPVQSPHAPDGTLLVTFQDESAEAPVPTPEPQEKEPLVRQLEYELKATREDLQSTVEELESANEEVMSMNEELQSANEELETSKEELQSLNEEVTTVNAQLQEKIEDLEGAANDMANLFNSTEIGTLFLDTELRVKRFTPSAAQLFNLIASDVGRRASDFSYNFADPDLLDDCKKVLEHLTPRTREVGTNDQRWCIRRVIPYRTIDNRIEGVVITLVDITERKLAEEKARELAERLDAATAERNREVREREHMMRTMIATAAEGIIILDNAGVVQSINDTAAWLFGYQAEQLAGKNVKEFLPAPLGEWAGGPLDQAMSKAKGGSFRREIEVQRKDGSSFPLEVAISQPMVRDRRVFMVILRDISERRALEKEILDIAANEQRRIGQDLHDGVGQELTALALLTSNLSDQVDKAKPDKVRLVEKIAEGLRRVLGQVRALSRGLLPVEVDAEGLMSALRDLADRVTDHTGVQCTFTCEHPVRVLDNSVATHLFRIAQEAVSNALNHGKATKVDIELAQEDGGVQLRIKDNGSGIVEGAPTSGLGLKIMQYRANLIGGNFRLEANPSGGTIVSCRVS